MAAILVMWPFKIIWTFSFPSTHRGLTWHLTLMGPVALEQLSEIKSERPWTLCKVCRAKYCIPNFKVINLLIPEKSLKGFYKIWVWWPCCSHITDGAICTSFHSPTNRGFIRNFHNDEPQTMTLTRATEILKSKSVCLTDDVIDIIGTCVRQSQIVTKTNDSSFSSKSVSEIDYFSNTL